MSARKTRFYITDKERELLEAIIEHGTMSEAAKKLGISISTASARWSRLMDRLRKARELLREWEYYEIRLPRKYVR
mgnify:CR=1 FL=1